MVENVYRQKWNSESEGEGGGVSWGACSCAQHIPKEVIDKKYNNLVIVTITIFVYDVKVIYYNINNSLLDT